MDACLCFTHTLSHTLSHTHTNGNSSHKQYPVRYIGRSLLIIFHKRKFLSSSCIAARECSDLSVPLPLRMAQQCLRQQLLKPLTEACSIRFLKASKCRSLHQKRHLSSQTLEVLHEYGHHDVNPNRFEVMDKELLAAHLEKADPAVWDILEKVVFIRTNCPRQELHTNHWS